MTNQITTVLSPMDRNVDELNLEDDNVGHVTAALGNTWAHAVNTRLTLQYLHQGFRQVGIIFIVYKYHYKILINSSLY